MKAVFLFIILISAVGNTPEISRTRFETIEQCNDAISKSRIEIPASGDAETSYLMFCAESEMDFFYPNGDKFLKRNFKE